MLAEPVTSWKNRFPSTTHYHNPFQKAITHLHNLWVKIYEKVPAGKEKALPARRELSTVPFPFLAPLFQRLFALFTLKKILHLWK